MSDLDANIHTITIQPDDKPVMVIKKGSLWVDPDVETNEAARKVIGAMSFLLREPYDRIEALEAELAEAQRDAGRYKALRDSGRYAPSYDGWWGLACNGAWTGEELDRAIDAAIDKARGA